MKKILTLSIVFFMLSASAVAKEYKIDYSKSSIGFAGMHAATPFKGVFEKWNAVLDFDPENLEESKFRVDIDTSTAVTGNKMYDGTLRGDDWFNVSETKEAIFLTTSISSSKPNFYTVEGLLSIRNISKKVSFDFSVTPEMLASGKVEASATTQVKRLDFDMGRVSDEKAEWVDNDITLTLTIVTLP